MAQWTILLFSLYGVLHGQGMKIFTQQECCQHGTDWAQRSLYCILPYISSSYTCRLSQEQCCAAGVEDRLCEKGIQMSKEPLVCEESLFQGEPWETQMSQMCCDCCMLGLLTASRGSSCELQGLLLGRTCLHTARDCCHKNTTVESQPSATEIQFPTEQECCQHGRDWAERGEYCAYLNLTSSSPTCRIAQEQCCAAAVEDRLCEKGIQMSKDQWVCERPFFQGEPWETKISKMCCDCCMLGLLTEGQGSSCEFQGLLLGKKCLHTARDCCHKNTAVEIQPSATAPVTEKPRTRATAKPLEGWDPCLDYHCSQLCNSNGLCSCRGGYKLKQDGVNCEDIDECALGTHNCEAASVCTNTDGSFLCAPDVTLSSDSSWDANSNYITPVTEKPRTSATAKPLEGWDLCLDSHCSQLCDSNGLCSCRGGYKLKQDGVNCEDVNECLTHSHNCVLGQVCINEEGSFRCQWETSCGPGYELKDDNTCQDIDECALGTHNCEAASVCTNTDGSFLCAPSARCSGGFIRDAVGNCIDVNECVAHASPCPLGQTCVNTLGSYTCRANTAICGLGYRPTQDGSRCEDVDECRTGNVCVGHGCVNLVGTYRCECKPGYALNTINKLCEDIDECELYPGRLCSHICENTDGSYRCSCTSGFKLLNNRYCEDVNECDANLCSQECTNVFGSYQCYCRSGYQLSDIDGRTCEDIDECALLIEGHMCSYRCLNVPGSFHCTCPPKGYALAHDGRTCQDIDECAVGSHTCLYSESCFNIQGGFRCLSFTCPQNFRQAGQGTTKHASIMGHCVKACQHDDKACDLNPLHVITHVNISPLPFRLSIQPREIVYLQTAVVTYHATDVFFELLVADDQFSFDVVKRTDRGIVIGVVRQVKHIHGPKDLILEVAINYVDSKRISYRNIVVIRVFIPEFWF